MGDPLSTTAPFRITINNVRIGDNEFDIQVLDNEGNLRSGYTTVRVRQA